ncbi:hypothetical protein RIMD111065_33230 [Aeromonas hydrophila]|nr:hypothetical protein RIMD111065_33230 [Aeromonas hydrophila]
MLEVADEHGEVEFSITNTEDYRQYISTAVSEIHVENGQLKKKPYTRDNISTWEVEVHPARTIVEKGFKKKFRVKYAQKIDVGNTDKAYQISFVPTPYFGEGSPSNTVKIAFGFAPIVIIPAKVTQPIEYELNVIGDNIQVENKGKTYFSLSIDGCDGVQNIVMKNECSINATLLAGRKMSFPIPSELKKQNTLKARLVSHGAKFKVEAKVARN